MKRFMFVIFSLIFTVSLQAEPELKGSPNELRGFLHPTGNLVTITENAEEKAYSDIAVVSVLVTTEGKLLSDALAANTQLRKGLTESLINGNIQADNINSSKFSSSPQYGWFGKKPSSYKVINRLSIKLFDEKQLELVAKIADQHLEVELSDTEFEHSDKELLKEKVQKLALEKINKKKVLYESGLGVKLSAIGVADIRHGERATAGAMYLEEAVVTAAMPNGDFASSRKYSAPRAKKTTSFDEVVYSANISVTFKVAEH